MCVCVYRKNKADVGFCTITVSGSHWGSWNISFLDKGGGCVTVFQYFNNWVSLWYTHFGRRQWHPTPVLLPGKIPWAEEPGGLQSMGSLKSRTWLSNFTFTFHFHALEKEMATHSSVLAWRIPGMGEPGRLLFMGSHRVGHDWSDLAAAAHTFWRWLWWLGQQWNCTTVTKFHKLDKYIIWFISEWSVVSPWYP